MIAAPSIDRIALQQSKYGQRRGVCLGTYSVDNDKH